MNTGMAGLSLDQAPPLSVPLGFFFVAPLALVAAGVLLCATGAPLLTSSWMPQVLGATHVGTLGLLGAVMLGALYQMLPVVVGAQVPGVRLAHLVLVAFVAGAGALVWGLWTSAVGVSATGGAALGFALVLFLAPVTVALARAPAAGPTRTGMRLAVAALAVVGTLGVTMALAHTAGWALDRRHWLVAHAVVGLVGWVGGLLTAVSWQVVPMFYLTPAFPRRSSRVVLAAAGVTTPLALGALAVGVDPAWAALPGALAVWLLHPIVTLRLLAARKRRRSSASVNAWKAGLTLGPVTLACGVVAAFAADPRWPLLFGWLAVWGWAGLVLHGMLTRIVPFLVWFHRFSEDAGRPGVPSMRQLMPNERARVGLILHGAAVLLGAAAIVSGVSTLLQVAGVVLAAAGVALGYALVRAVVAREP